MSEEHKLSLNDWVYFRMKRFICIGRVLRCHDYGTAETPNRYLEMRSARYGYQYVKEQYDKVAIGRVTPASLSSPGMLEATLKEAQNQAVLESWPNVCALLEIVIEHVHGL